MKKIYLLETHHDPLAATRRFLADLWQQAGLVGLLAPVVLQAEPGAEPCLEPRLLSKPEELAQVDPFAPVLPLNAARLANRLDREHLGRPLGAVLRSCEIRALAAPQNWLLIGVDCIGSYPVDEYAWRVDKAGTPEELTSQTLKNARQGGIALHRFRSACQMCPEPESPQSDLSIHLLGLPVRESLLVKAHDDRIAGELDLERLTGGPAPAWLVEQHEEMVARVRERRQRKQRRIYAELPPDLPGDIEELLAHLKTCQSCRECLDACPNFHGQWDPAGVMDDAALERVQAWLVCCVSCGMCEQACPNHLPLAAVMGRISRAIKQSALAV